MRITGLDSLDFTSLGIRMEIVRRRNGAPHTASTTVRNRAGARPAMEGATRDALDVEFTIVNEGSKTSHAFNQFILSAFAPGDKLHTLRGILTQQDGIALDYVDDDMDSDVDADTDAEPLTSINVAAGVYITSIGGAGIQRWAGTMTIVDPYWDGAIDRTATADTPINIQGLADVWPTLTVEDGVPCYRQRFTFQDRSGNGFHSLIVSVLPAHDLAEDKYIVYIDGIRQPFRKHGSRLAFRVSVKAESAPTYADVYMGDGVDGSLLAGTLETFGVTLDADIEDGIYKVNADNADQNSLAPAMVWLPAVTGDHGGRRRYSYGMNGPLIILQEDGISGEQRTLANDADGYTIITGIPAQRIRALSFQVHAGYQMSQQEAAIGPDGRQALRYHARVLSPDYGDDAYWVAVSYDRPIHGEARRTQLSQYAAQWTFGLTTFPTFSQYTHEQLVYLPDGEGTIRITGTDYGHRYVPPYITTYRDGIPWITRRSGSRIEWFPQLAQEFLGVTPELQPDGAYILRLPEPPPAYTDLKLSLQPTQYRSELASDPSQRPGAVWKDYIPSSRFDYGARARLRNGDVANYTLRPRIPVVVAESSWVDGTTLEPLQNNPNTAGLLPYGLSGVIRVSVVYKRVDSMQWITAWTDVIQGGYPAGKTISYNGLDIATPGAVQIAVRLEPMANRPTLADWGTLEITSVPEIVLDPEALPLVESSSAVDARYLNGYIRNTATGEEVRLRDVLVDAPGIILPLRNGEWAPAGGVGPRYGAVEVVAEGMLPRLVPGENAIVTGGDVSQENVLVAWNDRWPL